MNLDFTPEQEAFRQRARAWLEANVPTEAWPSGDTREGFGLHVAWERRLFEAGWAVVSWPREYGGLGASLVEWLIFEEEYYRAGAPQRVTQNGIFLLAPTIFEFGTEAQKARILKKMASAEVLWAQGWSEPGAGSDLAAVRSTGRRVEGGWRVNGQKTWCTRAAFCDAVYGLFRTDPGAERHRGLTYLMIPLDAPGVQVRGFERLDGDEGFAEVFFEEVFVPDEDVIGPVNGGWEVAMATTSTERGLSLRSPGRFMATAQRLIDLYRRQEAEAARRGRRLPSRLREAVARAWVDAEAYRLYTFGAAARLSEGASIGAESSLTKVFWSEMDLRAHDAALALLGAEAELEVSPDALDGGHWMKGYQFALAGPIYAGTNEIQRNIIAQRVLGLPRK